MIRLRIKTAPDALGRCHIAQITLNGRLMNLIFPPSATPKQRRATIWEQIIFMSAGHADNILLNRPERPGETP